MKKTVALSLLMALLSSMCVFAADTEAIVTRLTISKLDGSEVHFALADKPVITFADGNLVISSSPLLITRWPTSR